MYEIFERSCILCFLLACGIEEQRATGNNPFALRGREQPDQSQIGQILQSLPRSCCEKKQSSQCYARYSIMATQTCKYHAVIKLMSHMDRETPRYGNASVKQIVSGASPISIKTPILCAQETLAFPPL